MTAYAKAVDLSEEQLREQIEEGEGRCTEFKRGLPRDEKVARSLCAFANTRGGWFLVGINDNGSLHGCPRPAAVIAQIKSIGQQYLSPRLDLDPSSTELDGYTIVATHIPVSQARPHCILFTERENEVVVRVGSSNRTAEGATLSALRAQRGEQRPLDPLESRVMDWVAERGEEAAQAGGNSTPGLFSQTYNIGLQRARKAFFRLERDGLLVGHGPSARRFFQLP
jgi:hypothetical protein